GWDWEQRKERIWHQKKKKELQAKIQGIKNAVPKNDKKRRKQLKEDVAKLEREMEQKHREELEQLKLTFKDSKADSVVVNISNLVLENQPPRISFFFYEICPNFIFLIRYLFHLHSQCYPKSPPPAPPPTHSHFLALAFTCTEADKVCTTNGPLSTDGRLEQDSALTVATLRRQAAEYMQSHSDDFLPFLTNLSTGDMYTPEENGKYCDDIVNTEAWGGQLELRALSHILQTPMEILQADVPPIIVGEEYPRNPLVLGYMRHGYSLGEHYNSVTRFVNSATENCN
uniref:ubiquitinyl hydrolase 1 n=1 Tax=Mus spicilegus TaxID=10103 RepID=A0A8C6GR28_MUSSI